jgi:hypothetical protein
MAGRRIRSQKNQARARVAAVDVASAEDFKISKAKKIERPGLTSGNFSATRPIMDVDRLPRRRFCEGG